MLIATKAAKAETNSVHGWCTDLGISLTTSTHTAKSDVSLLTQSGAEKRNDSGCFSLVLEADTGLYWVVTEGRKMVEGKRVRSCNIKL
jgi:hypothetical protein